MKGLDSGTHSEGFSRTSQPKASSTELPLEAVKHNHFKSSNPSRSYQRCTTDKKRCYAVTAGCVINKPQPEALCFRCNIIVFDSLSPLAPPPPPPPPAAAPPWPSPPPPVCPPSMAPPPGAPAGCEDLSAPTPGERLPLALGDTGGGSDPDG